MDFTGKKVVHKVWGEGVVESHMALKLYDIELKEITYGIVQHYF